MDLQLLRDIRQEVIRLLFNRYVFRTHQEIVRRNSRLQGRPRDVFCRWSQSVYVQAAAVGVRRLASGTSETGDVSLVRFLDSLISYPGELWPTFERLFRGDAESVRGKIVEREGSLRPGWEIVACKRLLCEDRKEVIRVAEHTNLFASKRVAHGVPSVEVKTKFFDLDEAIDVLKKLTEKYSVLACAVEGEQSALLPHAASPAIAPVLAQMDKYNRDLLEDMRSCMLPEGWESIFLEPWATPETIALALGEMPPPRH
jgi:hypothetical protein